MYRFTSKSFHLVSSLIPCNNRSSLSLKIQWNTFMYSNTNAHVANVKKYFSLKVENMNIVFITAKGNLSKICSCSIMRSSPNSMLVRNCHSSVEFSNVNTVIISILNPSDSLRAICKKDTLL